MSLMSVVRLSPDIDRHDPFFRSESVGLKYTIYCSCLQSDGCRLRFVRRFDSLSDCERFIKAFSNILCPDWRIVQNKVGLTSKERLEYEKTNIKIVEPELPF